jgi:rusticyanin
MGGMMSPGGMGAATSAQITSATAVRQQLVGATRDAQVSSSAGKIIYRTKQVSLVMVGAPPGRPGMYWQADGLVDPTILVPRGSTITVHFADGDPNTHHGWELTATPPPYPRMAMMEAWPVVPGAFAMPVPPPSGRTWYGRTLKFWAPPAGTYHYLCPVPGHAERGMWGTLIVL